MLSVNNRCALCPIFVPYSEGRLLDAEEINTNDVGGSSLQTIQIMIPSVAFKGRYLVTFECTFRYMSKLLNMTPSSMCILDDDDRQKLKLATSRS
ncbi:Hypothetical predicted protein, partial [Scomber scombrus]